MRNTHTAIAPCWVQSLIDTPSLHPFLRPVPSNAIPGLRSSTLIPTAAATSASEAASSRAAL